jgi:hypothetical protein
VKNLIAESNKRSDIASPAICNTLYKELVELEVGSIIGIPILLGKKSIKG